MNFFQALVTGGIAASQCVKTGGPAPSPGEATGGEKEDLAGELNQLPETSCTPEGGGCLEKIGSRKKGPCR